MKYNFWHTVSLREAMMLIYFLVCACALFYW